ncbi:MAG: amidase [Chloroflexi bacterium]|nr:amidase [Chloroflexota bacterium]
MDDLLSASATALAEKIRSKQVSSVEVVTANLNRINEVNPALNAVVQIVAERALSEAAACDSELARGEIRGPLHGAPFTLKDSHDTEGIISTGGTTGRSEHVPDADSPPTARLRAAGGVLLGKTNTPELTFAGFTDNLIYGRTSNPYDLGRTPGGSSGGAAAIVASGGSPFDLGSDTRGSIRGPANNCGIAGLKPTSGRVPRTGHIVPPGGLRDAFTAIGPLARRVEDLTLIFPLIAGPDWRDPYMVDMPIGRPSDVDIKKLRVATYDDNGLWTPTTEIKAAVGNAAASVADAGAAVTDILPAAVTRATALSLEGRVAVATGDASGIGTRTADGGAYTRMLLERYGTTRLSPKIQSGLDNEGALDANSLARFLNAIDLVAGGDAGVHGGV